MWCVGTDPALREDLQHSYQLAMQQAATVLARLLQQPVTLELPVILPAAQMRREARLLSAGVGISLAIAGELTGGLLLFLPQPSASWLCGQLLGAQPAELLTEPARSTLQEVGNIIASALLVSLEEQLHLKAVPAPPHISLAPLAALLDQLPGERPQTAPLLSSRFHCAVTAAQPVLISSSLCPVGAALQRLRQQR